MNSVLYMRWLRFKREYRSFVIYIGLTLFFTFFLGSMFSQGGSSIPIGVIDKSQSSFSQLLTEELMKTRSFSFVPVDENEGYRLLKNNRFEGLIVIPESFEQELANNKTPEIKIIRSKDSQLLLTLSGIVRSAGQRVTSAIGISDSILESVGQYKEYNENVRITLWDRIYRSVLEKLIHLNPVGLSTKELGITRQQNYNPMVYNSLGFTLSFTMFFMVFTIGDILDDKRNWTWQRLMITPLSKSTILSGYFINSFILGCLQLAALLIIFNLTIYKITHPLLLIAIFLMVVIYSITVTSLGLLISGMVKSFSQLSSIAPIVVMSTSMLGGCYWPMEIVGSKLLVNLSYITPQRWGLIAINNTIIYGNLNHIITPTIAMLTMSIIFFGIGIKMTNYE